MKSRGQTLRIAGIISAIEEGLQMMEDSTLAPTFTITREMLSRAINIMEYSTSIYSTLKSFTNTSQPSTPGTSPTVPLDLLSDDDIDESVVLKGAKILSDMYRGADQNQEVMLSTVRKYRWIPKLPGVNDEVWVKVSLTN